MNILTLNCPDLNIYYMSRVVRKPAFCICKNKDADQLRGNREADQHLCFLYTDSTIPLLPKSEISGPSPSTVAVQPGLCRTWSETQKTGFLTKRLILRDTTQEDADTDRMTTSTELDLGLSLFGLCIPKMKK